MRLDELIQQPNPKDLLAQAVIKRLSAEDLNYTTDDALHSRIEALMSELAPYYGQSSGPSLDDVYHQVMQWYVSQKPF